MALGVPVLLGFSLINPGTPYWLIGAMMFTFSICMGLQFQTLMVAVQAAAPRQDVGAATGSITLARMMGASLGLAANGGLLHAGLASGQAALPAQTAAQLPGAIADITPTAIAALPDQLAHAVIDVFSHAFSAVFYFGAGLFAVSLILALLLRDIRLPQRDKDREPDVSAIAVAAE